MQLPSKFVPLKELGPYHSPAICLPILSNSPPRDIFHTAEEINEFLVSFFLFITVNARKTVRFAI